MDKNKLGIALKGSSDFFGLNWYATRGCADTRPWRVLCALPSLVRMALNEPHGLIGALKAVVKGRGGNYFRDMNVVVSQSGPTTHMGWPVTPWGLARVLDYVQRTYAPEGGIYITENGVAVPGEDDVASACDVGPGKPGAKRSSYLRSHLVAVQRAIGDKGVDVRGFFLWSLLDNFEWAFGYARRFGAYHVDYQTLQRTPKPVVAFYRTIIEGNAVKPTEAEATLDVFAPAASRFRVDDW